MVTQAFGLHDCCDCAQCESGTTTDTLQASIPEIDRGHCRDCDTIWGEFELSGVGQAVLPVEMLLTPPQGVYGCAWTSALLEFECQPTSCESCFCAEDCEFPCEADQDCAMFGNSGCLWRIYECNLCEGSCVVEPIVPLCVCINPGPEGHCECEPCELSIGPCPQAYWQLTAWLYRAATEPKAVLFVLGALVSGSFTYVVYGEKVFDEPRIDCSMIDETIDLFATSNWSSNPPCFPPEQIRITGL